MTNKIAEFMECCAKLETMEFYGLTVLLGVKIEQEENKEEMRPFEEIMEDMLVAFNNKNRKMRREIMKVLKTTTKGRGYYKREVIEENEG